MNKERRRDKQYLLVWLNRLKDAFITKRQASLLIKAAAKIKKVSTPIAMTMKTS